MKKHLTHIFLFLLLISSCRKDKKESEFYTAADINNMIVTEHDSVIQSFPNTNFNITKTRIDLDNNGFPDITFKLFVDSVNYPNDLYVNITVGFSNDQFSVMNIPEKDSWYETSYTEDEWYGTYKRITTYITRHCSYVDGATTLNSVPQHIKIFHPGELINKNGSFHSEYGVYKLYTNAHESAYWNFSMSGDSLIGIWYTYEDTCHLPALNEPFYIAFKKEYGPHINYGWIELSITHNQELIISRSAITPDE